MFSGTSTVTRSSRGPAKIEGEGLDMLREQNRDLGFLVKRLCKAQPLMVITEDA